jgi:hypothetical protein
MPSDMDPPDIVRSMRRISHFVGETEWLIPRRVREERCRSSRAVASFCMSHHAYFNMLD